MYEGPLKEWIEQAREIIYVRNRLRADASLWSNAISATGASPEDDLWSGSRLHQALELRDSGEIQRLLGELAWVEEQFLDASMARRDQRELEEQNRQELMRKKDLEKQRQRAQFLKAGAIIVGCFLVLAIAMLLYARMQQRIATQRELDMLVEKGRHLLVEQKRPTDALLWLHRAYEQGSRSPILPYLLADATRPLDAMALILSGHEDSVNSASYSPKGRRIVTASKDKTARVWDADSGKLLFTLRGHTDSVTAASYSPDGLRIITGSADGTARIWDATKGQSRYTLRSQSGGLRDATFSPDGHRILTTSSRIVGWDGASLKHLFIIEGKTRTLQDALFDRDSRRILMHGGTKTLGVWDAESGKQLSTIESKMGRVDTAVLRPQGDQLAVSGYGTGISILDIDTGDRVLHWDDGAPVGRPASFSPDGNQLATIIYYDKEVKVWDVTTGQLITTLVGHTDFVNRASYSPDGRRIVTASDDKTARVWDLSVRKLLSTLHDDPSYVGSARYRPGGSSIMVVSSPGRVYGWDADNDQFTVRNHRQSRWLPSLRGAAQSGLSITVQTCSDADWKPWAPLTKLLDPSSGFSAKFYRQGSQAAPANWLLRSSSA